MKASIRWIKELLPELRARPPQIAQRLTAAGLEVEGLDNEADALEGVVTAEVRELSPHPNADRLRVAQVFDGETTRNVVCGAPNVAQGQKVAFAPSGLTLPNGLTLERRQIRGVDSDGMICSEAELGLSDEADGILVLKPRTRPGKPLVDVLDLKDVVLELGITPNRADALCHLGLARELAALYRLSAPKLSIRVRESGEPASELAKVDIKDRRCPKYVSRVLTGVKVGPSPGWLQRRLRAIGLRPISNVVDATNVVMMELGQPMHGFDLDRLEGQRIIVRSARAGEKITLLDRSEHTLTPEDLVIADGKAPVALAGVMGGADSEVHDGTHRVLLEAAVFEPQTVRASARKRGLHTDASHRFERGIDPTVTEHAVDRCAQLILELAGGVVHKGRVGVDKTSVEPPVVPIRPERASLLIGRPFDKKEIRDSLVALGLKPVRKPVKKTASKKKAAPRRAEPAGEAMFFQTPPWRVDLHREEDLIEEVGRLAGYDDLPAVMPPGPTDPWTGPVPFDPEDQVRETLVGEGFLEAISLAFHGADAAEAFGLDLKLGVMLANPLGEERGYMRMSLLPALLRAAQHNQDQLPSMTDLRLFEVGRTFKWQGAQPGELPEQPRRVGLLMRGRRAPAAWFGAREGDLDAYDLKAVVQAVLRRFSVSEVTWNPADTPWLHPRSATMIGAGGEVLGYLGEAHPDLMDRYALEGPPVFVAELDIEVLASRRGPRAAFSPLPRHPPSQRDLSFFVDQGVQAADVLRAIRAAPSSVPLEELMLFDVYEGEGVPAGQKSLAVKMTFRAEERTLTDNDVDGAQAAIVDALRREFDAKIREA